MLKAPEQPFNIDVALALAKNHEHETVLYTEHGGTITVPVTSGEFQGYQVIVMQDTAISNQANTTTTAPPADEPKAPKFPTGPNEVHTFY